MVNPADNSSINSSAEDEELCSHELDPSEDHLNNDERDRGDWKSRWCPDAKSKIRNEGIYVGIVLVFTLAALICTWRGTTFDLLSGDCRSCSQHRFNTFVYVFLGGVLGGTLFGIKYLYRVVARGYWNEDRILWRVFSPFISGGLALAIGTLLDSGVLGLSPKIDSVTYYFSIGFISGYFADSALAKMQEIAETIFGSHLTKRSESHQRSEE